MKNITLLIISLLLLSLSLPADDRQFYFVAKEGRLGSLSQTAKDDYGVYLRWDLMEGELPLDISTLVLLRVQGDTETELLNVDATAVMSNKEIAAMFQEGSAQRTLFETIDAISKNESPTCTNANISNIGEVVSSCLEDNYWSFLASKVNFNIAKARYRAYLDIAYDRDQESVEYILVGKNAAKTKELILGKTTVSLKLTSSVLMANNFTQIIDSKCNDNRYGLDDYKVALYWKNGGENATEFFANGLMISGYDLYYSTKPTSEYSLDFAEKLDIRELAQNLPHDAQGNVILKEHGIAKANETLITMGEKDADGTKPVYVESSQEIQERGFLAGEKRYYFLVPRDFTGNYGPTAFIEVTIPDLLPPPAPINPRTIEVDGKPELIWDTVKFPNYVHYHKNDMKVCSTETIQAQSRVRFVDIDESCTDENGIILNFNVAKYYVYRFDNGADAAGFEDLDLDGYNDFYETDETKCSPDFPVGINSNLVAIIDQTDETTIHFKDLDAVKAQFYWYRVVSVTESQIASNLTSPIRAFAPKRDLLPAPSMSVVDRRAIISTEVKESSDSTIAQDNTSSATRVEIDFFDEKFSLPLNVSSMSASLSSALKGKLFSMQGGSAKITFYNENTFIKSRTFNMASVFNFNAVRADDKKTLLGYAIIDSKTLFMLDEVRVVLTDGLQASRECVEFEFEQDFIDEYAGKACLETTLAVGNSRYKYSRDCSLERVKEFCLHSLNGDMVSVGVRAVLYSGLATQSVFGNYVTAQEVDAPNEPSLAGIEMDIATLKATISVQPQMEKVTGTMVYLYEKNSDKTFTTTVTHIGKDNPSELIDANITGITAISIGDTWCAKAKTIGLDGQMSKWSLPICQEILAEDENRDNLMWPEIQNAVGIVNQDLNISFNAETGLVEIELAQRSESIVEELTMETVKVDYTRVIAKDLANTSVSQLELTLHMDEALVYQAIINEQNGEYILPAKLDFAGAIGKVNSNDLAERLVATLTFKNAAGLQMLETTTLKQIDEQSLFYYTEGEDQLRVSQQAHINTKTTENLCYLVDAINRHTNYVVYRQSVKDGVYGKFVQVSPLIEAAKCVNNVLVKSNNIAIDHFGENMRVIKFIDRYPYVIDTEYRYVLLYFDTKTAEPWSYTLTTPETVEVH